MLAVIFVHQIWKLSSNQHTRLVGQGTFQNVNCASAATSSPISTLMYSVSLKT